MKKRKDNMKTTFGALVNPATLSGYHPALGRLLEHTPPAKYISLAYRLGKLMRELAPELRHFEELRIGLWKEYGQPTPEGNGYTLDGSTSEQRGALFAALDDLLQTEVVLSAAPIPVELWGEAGFTMNALDCTALDWLMGEPSADPKE